jgi:16S rRNA (uracil1498-N3)-methyltransferase
LPDDLGARWLLGFGEGMRALAAAPRADRVVVLSGPEGGLAAAEVAMAAEAGFVGISLGPRVLRADTAPLAVLGWLGGALA